MAQGNFFSTREAAKGLELKRDLTLMKLGLNAADAVRSLSMENVPGGCGDRLRQELYGPRPKDQ